VQAVVDDGGGGHESRVDRAADDAAQRVPRAVVEPVQEVVEALARKVLGRAEVEVRVELVNDLVAESEATYPRQSHRAGVAARALASGALTDSKRMTA
jgi:pyocin large subunit-like protein